MEEDTNKNSEENAHGMMNVVPAQETACSIIVKLHTFPRIGKTWGLKSHLDAIRPSLRTEHRSAGVMRSCYNKIWGQTLE